MQGGYPDLVAAGLEERFGVKVAAKNLSVSGMDSAWGREQVGAVVTERPDLVLLAFGMNDASGRRTPEEFASITGEIRDRIRKERPGCSVIVISPMTANPEWSHSAPELYPAYAAALGKLAGAGTAAADVTAVWTAVAARKTYLSLTGNGLNHPNDFGHRLYADVVLAVIGAPGR
jgi:lysophospholipase L1-like esterase